MGTLIYIINVKYIWKKLIVCLYFGMKLKQIIGSKCVRDNKVPYSVELRREAHGAPRRLAGNLCSLEA